VLEINNQFIYFQDLSLAMRLRSDVSSANVTNDSNKENISVTQPSANSGQELSEAVEQLTSTTPSGSGFDSAESSLIKPPALINSEHL
jgi:hypothetical protein